MRSSADEKAEETMTQDHTEIVLPTFLLRAAVRMTRQGRFSGLLGNPKQANCVT